MADLLLTTVWLVPGYALLGTLLASAWSPGMIRKTGPRPSGYINLVLTFFAFSHSLLALTATWNQPAQQISWTWLNAAGLNLTLDLKISALTVGAMALVTGLNLLAQIFAVGYMEMDWGWGRFYAMLGVFEAGLCALILCNSLFFTYVILEILTLGTYLLVGLWFSQPLVVTGARDAFLTKRVGDLILLMGVVALLPLAGTWNFDKLAQWAQTAHLDPKVATLLGLALIAGPLGKCAQFPLHLWLDEAMEGPIPSTILRNSVVVATGAWVLVKLQPVLALSEIATTTAIYIGAVTAVGASAIAIAQIDIKRSLSYSVSAYMGLVFIAVGTGETKTALMLLLAHAVAMALLIMANGGIIWNTITQDLTQYGGLWSRRPISGLAFLVGVAGLVALPPFGGFWALLTMAENLWPTHPELVGVLVVVNGLTAFSVIREFGLIFGGKPKPMTVRSPEVHWPMVLPMVVLMGVTLHIPLILMQWNLLPNWANLNIPVAGVLVGSTVVGGGLGAFVYMSDRIPKPVKFGPQSLQDFFAYDFYTAKLYKLTIVFAVGFVSQIVSWFDRYIVDGLVNLVGLFTLFSGQGLKYNVSGQTQFYALTILSGIAVLGILLAWPSLLKIFLIFN
ncbi:NAD(P)H-quinone oxidoreductase subunit F [Laspinema olomoucense]|uniref:NAD(P)H-quinone oxidoreductase subunit F n=1 Tax=Laspinema olomoucense TaxID=3231600 RepID=UPI0021BAA4E7|nr:MULTISPECIES: NAD(P)H-quinone oxidoreductase subunit F [unclassified Laspinema]MCT7989349.1 NAD(P)H-quinone oxidoreductase subunit F [Laspinema sp. D3a]MCT7992372.1 NAD(P)H-quinone oxidoreductase subunit F [Laspinema sp. D3c]